MEIKIDFNFKIVLKNLQIARVKSRGSLAEFLVIQ